MAIDSDKTKLLYKVAKAYYEDKLTYNQIGDRFGFSRMTVSRLLEQAREEKIVQIIIAPPSDLNADLERDLEKVYGLDEAVVVTSPSDDYNTPNRRTLGSAAANYLLRRLQGNEIISLAWGYTMSSVVDAMSHVNHPDIKVVQTTGGLGKLGSDTHAGDLVLRMAQTLGGKPYIIPAPGVVSNMSVRDTLLADTQISDALALAAKSDIALVGIGSPKSRSIVMDSGILTDEDLKQLQDSGAVGDIVLRYFDANGQPVHHEINERIIGLTLDHIKAIPCVIGVAGGILKFEVVQAALRNKLVNVLVTDDELATVLLTDAEKSKDSKDEVSNVMLYK